MTTATATNGNRLQTVEEYIAAHPDADPKSLFEVLLQQTEKLRQENAKVQAESKAAAEVEIDQHGQFRPKNLAGLWRIGQMFAQSGMVPDHYKNNVPNCAIGAQMALRCKVDILTFLQNSCIVHGKPGIEAKLAIAMLNASGKIKGRIRFKLEGEGKSRQCTASAVDVDTGETLSQTVTWAMVEAEGWSKKNGSKWLTLPDLMFQYRSAMFLTRVHFPDVLMGMHSTDEIEDFTAAEDPTKAAVNPQSLDELADRLFGSLPEGQTASDDKSQAAEADAKQEESKAETETEGKKPVETADADLREFATMELGAVTGHSDVEALRATLNKRAKTDADRQMIAKLCDGRADAIRATKKKGE